jgi:hypothetical protein
MTAEQRALILIGVLAAVVLINLGLVVAAMRKGLGSQIDIARRIADRARDPWGEESRSLSELRHRIEKLQQKPGESGHESTE